MCQQICGSVLTKTTLLLVCYISHELSLLPQMTGCDVLLFLVVTVQIIIQGIMWSTNNHVNNSNHMFRTAQLNMISNVHIYFSCCISLTVPRTVTSC
jgi:hypothetical protein